MIRRLIPVDIEQKLKIVREIMRSIKKIRQLLIELGLVLLSGGRREEF